MKHTFMINVPRKGYALFSGERLEDMRECPLDVQAREFGVNFLDAQQSLDAQLKLPILRWWFSIANADSSGHPVVAYASRIAARDDKGRSGIVFLHAIESDSELRFDAVVSAIVQILAQQRHRELGKLLAEVAEGSLPANDFMGHVLAEFARYSKPLSCQYVRLGTPIREIVHDCGSAAAVAWMSMAVSHVASPAPWRIEDGWSADDGRVRTKSNLKSSKAVYSLTELLTRCVWEDDAIQHLRSIGGDQAQDKVGLSGGSAENVLNQAKEETPIRVRESVGEQPSEVNLNDYVGPRPAGGQLSILLDWNGKELTLLAAAEGRIRNLKLEDCSEVKEFSAYFELAVRFAERWWGGVESVILPKISLNPNQMLAVREVQRRAAARKVQKKF